MYSYDRSKIAADTAEELEKAIHKAVKSSKAFADDLAAVEKAAKGAGAVAGLPQLLSLIDHLEPVSKFPKLGDFVAGKIKESR